MAAGESGRALPRLFVDSPLAAGETVPLAPAQAHYLRTVLRLGDGAGVAAFNGRDGEWRAVLAGSGSRAALRVEESRRAQPESRGPWLLFAPLKKDATDYVVQKAVELGCRRLCPVLTRRTQTRTVRLDRLQAQAIEAAEQCERLDIPLVDPLRPLAETLADWPRERRLFVLAERRNAAPAARCFAQARGQDAAFLVGPEGGLDDTDLDAVAPLASCACTVDLGPRILRAETAGAAALAVWQAVAGDWSDP
ncbi:16S rRNA (uracil(1498)-N(3))-methyltransferase [Pararhodospirillum oryzae]|uniref:Ribosomal RNA small subunit methyltransferase E n=1 Tax=Pararhodospirillum oryzae TaxID=478448 RepID=A0A512H764_9PROT|nr:16S rRNA (uracil(1498)-N(3))-methyltransferase [Pararhodospirillum oryzae]GEO81305.1 ribosomal RNA small subunit methyltransferase E [Pararhodospirillum oryzae]